MQIVFALFIAFSMLRGYLAFASVKKEKVVSVFVTEPRAKKKSKSEFDKEWAAKLAESNKDSFYQQEKWLEELDIQKSENAAVAESASRSKIQLGEPDVESQLSSSTLSADGKQQAVELSYQAKSRLRNWKNLYLVYFAREESKSWKM